MAILAYGLLDTVNADLRYHAAVLYAEPGSYPEALALADTILAAVQAISSAISCAARWPTASRTRRPARLLAASSEPPTERRSPGPTAGDTEHRPVIEEMSSGKQ